MNTIVKHKMEVRLNRNRIIKTAISNCLQFVLFWYLNEIRMFVNVSNLEKKILPGRTFNWSLILLKQNHLYPCNTIPNVWLLFPFILWNLKLIKLVTPMVIFYLLKVSLMKHSLFACIHSVIARRVYFTAVQTRTFCV